MNTESIKKIWHDLRCFKLFPKRRGLPQEQPRTRRRKTYYWNSIGREYSNWCKRLSCTDFRWFIITYKDGTEELAYIKLRQGGILSGMLPDAYRGIIIPRQLGVVWYSNVKDIRIAF